MMLGGGAETVGVDDAGDEHSKITSYTTEGQRHP